MYLQNKYSKWYFNIIDRSKNRILEKSVYTEKHHIIPKSLGGSDANDNIAVLTGREHFICHLLLPKFTTGAARAKMIYAAWRMCCCGSRLNKGFKISSSTYESIRQKRSEHLRSLKGQNSPMFGKKTGRTSSDFTKEWREKISAAQKGKVPWNKGIPRTDEEKAKMSSARKLKASDPTWNIRPKCRPEKAQKIKEANTGKRWVHKCNPLQRRYVSQQTFEMLCSNGWTPGLGPKKSKTTIPLV